jgi:hypothetical protein
MARSENDRRIDYIEMNVTDIARAKKFYGAAFGWTFKDYGPDYCEFADGRLTGGFTTHGKPSPGGRRRSSTSRADSDSTSSIPMDTSSRSGRNGDRRQPAAAVCGLASFQRRVWSISYNASALSTLPSSAEGVTPANSPTSRVMCG